MNKTYNDSTIETINRNIAENKRCPSNKNLIFTVELRDFAI